MFDIVIRRNDNLPVIEKSVYAGGSPVDLSGYDVNFVVFSLDGAEIFSHDASVVLGGANNKVQYEFTTADAQQITGQYAFAHFVATFAGDVFTTPNNRPLSIMLTDNTHHEYSYSGDPSARAIDKVRFLLNDTNLSSALFTDSEITFLVDQEGSAYAAAAEAAFVQSGKFASLKDKTVGPLSVSYGSQAERWTLLAKSLLKRGSRRSGAVAITTQTSREPHIRLGMNDNHDYVGYNDPRRLGGESL